MSEWDDKLFWGLLRAIKLILNKEVPHFIINIVKYFWETVLTAMVFLWKSRCRSQDKSLASVPDLGSDSGSGSLIFGLSFCLVCTYTVQYTWCLFVVYPHSMCSWVWMWNTSPTGQTWVGESGCSQGKGPTTNEGGRLRQFSVNKPQLC